MCRLEMGVPSHDLHSGVSALARQAAYSTGCRIRSGAESIRRRRSSATEFLLGEYRADVPLDRGYPDGPIKPGGLTDGNLRAFPNLYADMSANSGNNALSRDKGFAKDFVARHKDKLIFGSDCQPARTLNGAEFKGTIRRPLVSLESAWRGRRCALLKELASVRLPGGHGQMVRVCFGLHKNLCLNAY